MRIENCSSLQSILDYNEEDFEEIFCLNFEITREAFGEQISVELLPNGKEISVTLKNKCVSTPIMITRQKNVFEMFSYPQATICKSLCELYTEQISGTAL